MANMTTQLVEFTDMGNSRTYTVSGHTALKPKLVIQKRTVASVAGATVTDSIAVVVGTTDVDGNVLSKKVMFRVEVERSNLSDTDDVTAGMTLFREIIASDNFANVVSTQNWVQV